MKFRFTEAVTIAVRLIAFAVTMFPVAVMFLPWVTLDGGSRARSGIACITLLVSPIRDYLYQVDTVQAAILTLGPALIVLLSIATGNYYYQRNSVFWSPLAMLAVALAIIFMTNNLVSVLHEGPRSVAAVATLLIVHQIAIRMQVVSRRNRRLAWLSKPLAIATGIGEYRRRRRFQ